ncbi:MAG: DUF995 domain-containing protein [Alphaproteobacteria bacterium]|nr:DUF995 domain-containing protein [Alphaproteobacteria bacterium]
MIRASTALLMVTAAGALGACSGDNLPATATSAPATPTTTTTVVTTQPAAPTGTVVTAPGAAPAVPSSGSSTVTTSTTTVAPSPRLSSLEVLTLLNGSTASGTASNGNPYYAHFQRSGRVDLHQSSATVETGTWHVTDDGQLCSSFSNVNAGAIECYTIYRNGTNYVYERPDGHPVGSFVVQPGA